MKCVPFGCFTTQTFQGLFSYGFSRVHIKTLTEGSWYRNEVNQASEHTSSIFVNFFLCDTIIGYNFAMENFLSMTQQTENLFGVPHSGAGIGLNSLLHVKILLTLLFAIENIAKK